MSLLDQATQAVGGLTSKRPLLHDLSGNLEELFQGFLTQDTRLVEVHFSADSGIPDGQLLVHRLSGYESINVGFRYEAECLAADAFLELKELAGVPVQVTLLTASGAKRAINGVVTEVRSEGSDGSLAVYRLILEPVTAALKLSHTSRVFLGKTDLEVVLLLLQEELQNNPVFTACLSLDNRCKGTFPAREFVFLCNETKWDFIRRRLAKIGVSFVFAPTQKGSPELPQHTLIFFNDSRDLDENEAGSVRFHRADGTEAQDAITQWHARRALQCGQVTRRTYDHRTGSLSTTTEALQSDQGQFGNALASTLEDYRQESPLEHDDLQAHEGLTPARAKALEQRTKAFAGEGSVRDFRAGTTFTLSQHPVHDQDSPQSRKFVLTHVELEAENNLPKGLKAGLRSLARTFDPGSQGASQPAARVYRNRFECLRQGIPLLPEELSAPDPGLQTATVVGPANEAVHTDELGRIKVRLHSTREEEHPEAGASGTDKDSFWIRLLQPWSSQGMGGNFLLRTGDEALLDFLHGDPDKPVVIGVLPGGVRKPGRFSDASALPGDKAISGFRSRMHGGFSGNEFLLDDTPRELRARLASDHASTELNLGFNVHPRRNGRAAPKGEGAELRTDAAVAIRGGQGIFLSAEARPGACGSQLSRGEALGHLGAALALTKTLGDLGGQHGGDPLETKPQADLLKAAEDWEKGTSTDPKSQGGKAPILLASAPAGIALASDANTTLQAASNLDLVALRHVQLSAGKRLLVHALESIGLFAHRLGLKLIAASGDVSIQAQDGLMELLAAKVLRLLSVGGRIELDAAEGIFLRSGGAFLEIKNGSIKAGGTGNWQGQFAGVSWVGPASQEAKTRSFGQSNPSMDERFVLVNPLGEPAKQRRYRITKEDGSVLEGVSDDQGHTERCTGDAVKALTIHVFGPEEA